MASQLIVRPTTRAHAKELCYKHPHARNLPNSSKYYFVAYINGKIVGLAAWGWGVQPKGTINKLFGLQNTRLYLELNRFFMFEGTPKYYESKFLAFTCRLLFKHLPNLKFLFTYAAGFQGMTGIIYKACGFDYMGKQEMKGYHLIPGIGMVHDVSIYHRYGKGGPLKLLKKHHPDAVTLHGYNFCYIKFRDGIIKDELMLKATFQLQPYPTADEIKVWDSTGKIYTRQEAAAIPCISLKSSKEKAKPRI